jgi:hypothetical protein
MTLSATSLTVQFLAEILRSVMDLSDDQIWIYNQRREVPDEPGLYVIVGLMGMQQCGGGINHFIPGVSVQEELGQIMQETLTIKLFSHDTTAIARAPEAIGSFNSTYAQQIQERYGFKIHTVPVSMVDASFLEGGSIMYRMDITLKVTRGYSTLRPVEYYETFTRETQDQKGPIE